MKHENWWEQFSIYQTSASSQCICCAKQIDLCELNRLNVDLSTPSSLCAPVTQLRCSTCTMLKKLIRRSRNKRRVHFTCVKVSDSFDGYSGYSGYSFLVLLNEPGNTIAISIGMKYATATAIRGFSDLLSGLLLSQIQLAVLRSYWNGVRNTLLVIKMWM